MNPTDELTMRFLMAAFPASTVRMIDSRWRVNVHPSVICPTGAFFFFETGQEPEEQTNADPQ